MARRVTNQDKRIVAANLDKYLKQEKINPLLRVDRIRKWVDGYSMKEIAEAEGVSRTAVQVTIQPTVLRIVELYTDKPIDISK